MTTPTPTATELRAAAGALLAQASAAEHGVTTPASAPTPAPAGVGATVDSLVAAAARDAGHVTWASASSELVRLGGVALAALGATAQLGHGLNLAGVIAGVVTVIVHDLVPAKP